MKHTLAKYLMEVTITEYDMVQYLPSKIAAAALCLSIRLIDDSKWVLVQPITALLHTTHIYKNKYSNGSPSSLSYFVFSKTPGFFVKTVIGIFFFYMVACNHLQNQLLWTITIL